MFPKLTYECLVTQKSLEPTLDICDFPQNVVKLTKSFLGFVTFFLKALKYMKREKVLNTFKLLKQFSLKLMGSFWTIPWQNTKCFPCTEDEPAPKLFIIIVDFWSWLITKANSQINCIVCAWSRWNCAMWLVWIVYIK